MKTVLFSAAALSAAALCTSAFAQDDWAGWYAGVNVGANSADGESRETLVFDRDLNGQFNDQVTTAPPANANAFSPGFCGGAATSSANASCRGDDDGWEFGLRGGYDWQTGSWVFGVLGEASAVDVTDSVSGFSTTPASYTFTREANWIAAIRARAGYAAGSYLLYGTGGFVYADVDHRFDTSNGANAFTPRGDGSVSGHQWGLGVERKWNENWSLGLEYLYTTLQDDDYTVRVTQGTAPPTNPFVLAPNTTGTDIRRSENDFKFDSLRLTATYRY